MPRTTFRNLLAQNDLPQSFMYLAPILPVVQVMWADDRNQMPEREKIQLVLEAHCRSLTEMSEGVEPVSKADREKFVLMFVSSKPDFQLLNDFSEIALQLVLEKQPVPPAEGQSLNNPDHLITACMEIAAACAINYPAPGSELTQKRILAEERKLIVKVVELLKKGA